MRKMNGFGMMAKRGTAAAMAAAMALTMAGCGGSNAAETTAAADSEASENGDTSEAAASEAKGDIKVGVIQMIDNGAFADMRDGFSEELTEKYTGGKVDIVHKNAQGDAAALNTICQEMADSGVDLIATIADSGDPGDGKPGDGYSGILYRCFQSGRRGCHYRYGKAG